MASISAFSISKPYSLFLPSCALNHLQFQFRFFNFQRQTKSSPISCYSSPKYNKHNVLRPTKLRVVTEEEETLVTEEESSLPTAAEVAVDPTVSVSVSPSDILTMFFQAEGAMTDSAIPAVTKGLEGVEGITDLKVQIIEGIASVQLTKQTTVQATGVASNLVEIILGSGFKLQTLNLSFQDEEDIN